METEILKFIEHLLKRSDDSRVEFVSSDYDHNGGEIIVAWEGREYILSSACIKSLEDVDES